MVHCINRQNSQKTVKTAEITIGVPIVTCLHRVRRIHKAAQMPLPRETSITCAWAIATTRRLWAGLTMCLHGRPCVWFPFAAACCYTLFYLLMALYKFLYCIVYCIVLMMPAARLVCQRPSSNFPFFGPHSQTFCSPARTP